ncbi:hypothetical protein [Photobacterium kishitanii]|uniref:Uncharacterized protein n=1 Tax=Photobacterium kishitanii TaxID=318456 RepID=A0A2T3KL98_9GAMM|nr:hypothetical protein [Photobacterium kishitanii]PSV00446.1 hypothetical protein C9J27_04760 [Photobacterium kishitanii]
MIAQDICAQELTVNTDLIDAVIMNHWIEATKEDLINGFNCISKEINEGILTDEKHLQERDFIKLLFDALDDDQEPTFSKKNDKHFKIKVFDFLARISRSCVAPFTPKID